MAYPFHLAYAPPLATVHVACGRGGVHAEGVGESDGYHGTLVACEVFGVTSEVFLRHGLCSVDAIAHLYGVEIDLHDAMLVPEELYEDCEVGFHALAGPS